MAKSTKPKNKRSTTVQVDKGESELSVPWLKTGNYAQTKIHLKLTTAQAQPLRAIQDGLEYQGAELANGKRVDSAQKALMWVLEQLQASMSESQ